MSAVLEKLTPMERAIREARGCDAPAKNSDVRAEILCPRCNGRRYTGEGDDAEDCERCGATGYEILDRCPSFYMTPELRTVLDDYVYVRDGQLPIGGGLTDQAPACLQTHRAFHAELLRVGEEEAEEIKASQPRK